MDPKLMLTSTSCSHREVSHVALLSMGKKTIARELNISRNTVRKYFAMNEAVNSACLSDTNRCKQLDKHRDYILYLKVIKNQAEALLFSPKSKNNGIQELNVITVTKFEDKRHQFKDNLPPHIGQMG